MKSFIILLVNPSFFILFNGAGMVFYLIITECIGKRVQMINSPVRNLIVPLWE